MSVNVPPWLRWSRELIAIGQAGLEFARDPYDVERYGSVRRIGAEMLACASHPATVEQVLAALEGDIGYATPKIAVRAAVQDSACARCKGPVLDHAGRVGRRGRCTKQRRRARST